MADAYTALYRELRPKRFDDIVAQEHIKRTLRNQIITGRISHAYLFCGTKGTGKTSTAKVFARAVNCSELTANGEPCGADGELPCRSCGAILSGRSLDVIEIDAASNNGVDNIRDIREEVKYPPTDSKYRVFIIDEVHMLSAGAFNALLKTLEEPPEHVIFILATTDFQKVPPTIMSRCQRFDFRRIPATSISECIRSNIKKKNDITVDDNAIDYIAQISDGSLRDAFSILDQCISCYYGERITLPMVQENLGSVDDRVFFEMTDALNSFNGGKCIELIDRISMDGRDIGQFTSDLIMHFRNLLVSAVSVKSIDASLEAAERLKAQAAKIDAKTLISYVGALSTVQSQMRYAPNPKALLEVGCLRICNPQTIDDYSAISERLHKLESLMENGVAVMPESMAVQKKTADSPANMSGEISGNNKDANKSVREPERDTISVNSTKNAGINKNDEMAKIIKDGWKRFTGMFEMSLKPMLNTVEPEYINYKLYMVCENGQEMILKSKTDIIGSRLEESYGNKYDFHVICKKDFARIKNIEHDDSKAWKSGNRETVNNGGSQQSTSDGDGIDEMLKKINFRVDLE